MRAAEILRRLADIVDIQEQPQANAQAPVVININNGEAESATPETPCDVCGSVPCSCENPMDRDDVMIPPLQAKIEIMKKLAGIAPKENQLEIQADEDEPFEG
jgi:hypothetical protein